MNYQQIIPVTDERPINAKKVLPKTFIDETTRPYIRDFADEEIKEWLKDDTLNLCDQ